MSSHWPEHLDGIIEEFKDCFDSMERYELLFDYAKNNPNPLPTEEWTEENQILGCQSRAHVICSLDEGGNRGMDRRKSNFRLSIKSTCNLFFRRRGAFLA